jgi:hypothetical protein
MKKLDWVDVVGLIALFVSFAGSLVLGGLAL